MPELDRGKDWTWLLGSIAHSDHICKILPKKFLDRLRSMMTNIDADLLHDFGCHRVKATWVYPGTFSIEVIAGNQSQQRLGHLATCRICGTEKKNALFHGSVATTWRTTRRIVSPWLRGPNEGAHELAIDERRDGLHVYSCPFEEFSCIVGRINPGWF